MDLAGSDGTGHAGERHRVQRGGPGDAGLTPGFKGVDGRQRHIRLVQLPHREGRVKQRHPGHPSGWQETLQTQGDSDLYVQQNTWDPSACHCIPDTGWHTHPGPSLVIVTKGTVTAYDGDDPTCSPMVYTANTANNSFIDPGDGQCTSSTTRAVQLLKPSLCSWSPRARNEGKT